MSFICKNATVGVSSLSFHFDLARTRFFLSWPGPYIANLSVKQKFGDKPGRRLDPCMDGFSFISLFAYVSWTAAAFARRHFILFYTLLDRDGV